MLLGTQVMTSYKDGTTIHLDGISAKLLIENLAINTIVSCNKLMLSNDYNTYIDFYCADVENTTFNDMIEQNVQILYRLVEHCVLNKTVDNLSLFAGENKYNNAAYELILLALDTYTSYAKEYGLDCFEYNKYNKEFEELFIKHYC